MYILRCVRAVVHEKKVDVANVVDKESFVSRRHEMASFSV